MDLAIINAVPFIIALVIATPRLNGLLSKDARTLITTAIMALLFVSLIGYFPYVQEAGAGAGVSRVIEWVPELGLSLSFYLDGLSLIFSLIVTGIGAGIVLYAGYYFDDEPDQIRFLLFLTAFAGAMLGLVLSGNLLTLFIMWELTSVTSFMLIGFKGAKDASARFGANQAFLITGAGALALIVGFVLLAAATAQTLGLEQGLVFDLSQILQTDLADHPYFSAFAILIVIGAFTKSAQFPFHFWLPGAMAAPTPASAYLHSATMVKAGIYLLARLYPPMHNNELWTILLVGGGLITMLIGSFFALGQRDLKGLLAYSTVSKLGAIVALIGLPEYEGMKAALVGIIAHALYKAALFLVVGTIDHNTGTRNIDKLGSMRKYMPTMAVITVISGLSMLGMFPLFGFVAKEVLIDAFAETHIGGAMLALAVVVLSSVFTVTAALIVIWDVFFKEMSEEARSHFHFHASSPFLTVAPGLLAACTVAFGFLIPVLITPLLIPAIPKDFSLYLLPPEFWNVLAFQLSTGAIILGLLLFLLRDTWLSLVNLPLPRGTDIYQAILRTNNAIADFVLRSQNGQVRYYLIVIMGTVAFVILSAGQLDDLFRGNAIVFDASGIDEASFLRIVLLVLMVISAYMSVRTRRHINAALALGVTGYAVGGIFLLEPAPDVALVQLLVETLATILIVLILGRISPKTREEAMSKLWDGRTEILFYDNTGQHNENNVLTRFRNIGIYRDAIIAASVGFAVFLFTLTAVINRPDRESIAAFYLNPENTVETLGVTDVVGAIVADYRAMDTVLEIGVFTVAALGLLTLLSRGLQSTNPLIPKTSNVSTQGEFEEDVLRDIQDATRINTPFTRLVANLVLPLTFLLALSHIIFGSGAPGDGFTAGAISGLATALWYVVYGYQEAKARLRFFAPHRMLRIGLGVAVINGLLPILINGGGEFLTYLDYGKLIGIDGLLSSLNLKLTTTVIFECAIALTVFGGISAIMETIARPKESDNLGEDEPADVAAVQQSS